MADRTETIIYRYSGHCPECGAEQKGRQTESKADRVCDACIKKHAAERFEEKIAFLKGAKIIDFKGECMLNYDGNLGTCGISELTVLTEDGRTINVKTSRGLWREVEV